MTCHVDLDQRRSKQGTIDTLGRKNEKTFVLPARFKVSDLKAGVQAKVVKGRTLAAVSGRFELEEVPSRSK